MSSVISLFIPSQFPRIALTSVGFCAFFAVSLMLYYSLPKSAQRGVLLLSSAAFFVLSCAPQAGAYLLFASFAAYGAPLLGARFPKMKKPLCAVAAVIILAILAVLKYSNFIVINYNYAVKVMHRLFHTDFALRGYFSFLAPLGISFYTLMLVGYLLDCRSDKTEPERNFFSFLLFALWWPQLTSGPITRYEQISPQFCARRTFDYATVSRGIVRMLWGFFQKIVVAGHAVLIQQTYLGEPGKYDGFYVWIGMAAGVLQLYSDFNGCMDIVLGASECFGIRLPENFNVPFAATTVTEFWRRWHITLGRWLHDYVFFPVFGSKPVIRIKGALTARKKRKLANKIAMYTASGAVWFCMGLWHGGTWKYIIGNGLWYFAVTTLEQELAPLGRKIIGRLGIKTDCFSWRLFQRVRTFAFFCVGTTFFYASSLRNALRILKHSVMHFNPLVVFSISLEEFGMNYLHRAVFAVGVVALFAVDMTKHRLSLCGAGEEQPLRTALSQQNAAFRWLLYWTALTLIILSSTLSTQEFLYAQF